MIKSYCLTAGKLEEVPFHAVSSIKSMCWIDVTSPTSAELKELSERLHIHPAEIRHCIDQHEVPRVKHTQQYSLIIFGTVICSASEGTCSPMGMFLTRRYLLSIHAQRQPAIDDLTRQHDLVQQLLERGPEMVLYRILVSIIKEFAQTLNSIEDKLEGTEEHIIRYGTREGIQKIFATKNALLFLRKSLAANREVLLLLRGSPLITNQAIFDELSTEINQIMEQSEIHRERITSAIDLYLSLSSFKLNEVMKSFTLLTSLLVIPVFITGLYGMNVALPLQEHPLAFWIVFSINLLLLVVLMLFYRKKGWV